jgi:glucose/mannose transport system substrate-binding protein
MRPTARAGVAAALAALALAACSGPPGVDADDPNQVEVFTWWATGTEKVGLDALVDVFAEQYPDIRFVNATVAGGAGSNAKTVLSQRLDAGDPPDTFQAHAGAELTDYIEAGQLHDLSSFYAEHDLDDVFPESLIELLTVDGAIYSVPTNIHRANVVWANTEVLAAAGIDPAEPPADLDAWIDDLRRLRSAGVAVPLALGTEWTQLQLFETVLLADLGADGYSGLWTGETPWDDPAVATAVAHYDELLDYVNSDFAGLDWDTATQLVVNGYAGYIVMGDWAEVAFAQSGWTYDDEYTTFPVPGTSGVFDFLADSFVLTVGAPHEEATEKWLETISSVDGQQAFNLAKGSIPARTDVDASAYPEYQQTALASFADDVIVSSLAHGAAADTAWSNDILDAVGRFGTDRDVDAFRRGLLAAAAANAPAFAG